MNGSVQTSWHMPATETTTPSSSLPLFNYQNSWYNINYLPKDGLHKHLIHPRSLTARPWKMLVGRLLSFWDGLFSGAIIMDASFCTICTLCHRYVNVWSKLHPWMQPRGPSYSSMWKRIAWHLSLHPTRPRCYHPPVEREVQGWNCHCQTSERTCGCFQK